MKSTSREELELTVLRAIDHAAHDDAHLIEFSSRLEGAFGTVSKFGSFVQQVDTHEEIGFSASVGVI